MSSANPKIVVVTTISSSPAITVGLTPNLDDASPPGIPPASAPAG